MNKKISQIIILSAVAFFAMGLSRAFAEMDFSQIAQSQLATFLLVKDMNLGPKSNLRVLSERVVKDGTVDYVDVLLEGAGLGQVHLTLKGPVGFYGKKSRTHRGIFVASGFFTGRGTVRVLDSLDEMVVIGYEYPYSAEQMVRDPRLIYETLRQTPAQIAAALQWITERGFINRYELSVVGVSLGGLFLPSALHIAQTIGVPVRGAVFAYTGADLAPVVAQALKEQTHSDGVKLGVGAVQALTALHDPKIHLPFLQGQFLVIRADADKIFPIESSQKLEQLLPEPKRVEVLPGGHINIDQTELINKTQAVIKSWLEL